MTRWDDSTFDENPAVDDEEFAPVWEQLQEDLKEDARDTLPDLEEFIGEVLRARGIPVDDPVAAGGLEVELVTEWHNLQHAANRVRRSQEITGEEIGVAIEGARLLWANLKPTVDREDYSAVSGGAGLTRKPTRGLPVETIPEMLVPSPPVTWITRPYRGSSLGALTSSPLAIWMVHSSGTSVANVESVSVCISTTSCALGTADANRRFVVRSPLTLLSSFAVST